MVGGRLVGGISEVLSLLNFLLSALMAEALIWLEFFFSGFFEISPRASPPSLGATESVDSFSTGGGEEGESEIGLDMSPFLMSSVWPIVGMLAGATSSIPLPSAAAAESPETMKCLNFSRPESSSAPTKAPWDLGGWLGRGSGGGQFIVSNDGSWAFWQLLAFLLELRDGVFWVKEMSRAEEDTLRALFVRPLPLPSRRDGPFCAFEFGADGPSIPIGAK